MPKSDGWPLLRSPIITPAQGYPLDASPFLPRGEDIPPMPRIQRATHVSLRFCHQEVTDLTAHKRQIHASGFPSKCEIVQCPKWRRENGVATVWS